MSQRIRLGAIMFVVATALAVLTAGTATAAPPWKQPPRGSDQAWLSNCRGPAPLLLVGDDCVAAVFQVPSGGEALSNGEYTLTVPPGTTLTGTTVFDALSFGGANDCTWDETYQASGQTIHVTGLTCPQDSGFVVFFGANVASSTGTYTLSGDYKVNNAKRNASNVFRYATDPTVDVSEEF